MFWRVAIFIAVIICLVMHSSANALNDDCLSSLKSRIALYNPIIPSCTISSRSAPTKNMNVLSLGQNFYTYELNSQAPHYHLDAQVLQSFHLLVVHNGFVVFHLHSRSRRSPRPAHG